MPGSLDRLGRSHKSQQVMDAGRCIIPGCYRCGDTRKRGKLISQGLNILLVSLTQNWIFNFLGIDTAGPSLIL